MADQNLAPEFGRPPPQLTMVAPGLSRRGFMRTLAGTALGAFVSPVLAKHVEERSLSFVHTHTAEQLQIAYFKNGTYDPSALARVAHTLRDFRSGEVFGIDPVLLDALFELQVRSGHDQPYQIISAFRSPHTNSTLRGKSTGVAENSLHMKGKAVDIRVSGVSTKKLRDLALAMKRGGVGYYHDSNFLHVDTGRVRFW